MSDQDIKAGTNWSERIKKELANTTVGIVCLTPENQDAKWINYEMGALSKEVNDGESRVIPLLIGFNGTHEVGQPAASLNMVMLDQEGFKKIATSLNDISEVSREKADLDLVSDTWWEKLGGHMEAAAALPAETETEPRDEKAMIEEVLETVRDISKRTHTPRQVKHFHDADYNIISKISAEAIGDDFGYRTNEYHAGYRVVIKTERPITTDVATSIASKIRVIFPDVDLSFETMDEHDLETIAEYEYEAEVRITESLHEQGEY